MTFWRFQSPYYQASQWPPHPHIAQAAYLENIFTTRAHTSSPELSSQAWFQQSETLLLCHQTTDAFCGSTGKDYGWLQRLGWSPEIHSFGDCWNHETEPGQEFTVAWTHFEGSHPYSCMCSSEFWATYPARWQHHFTGFMELQHMLLKVGKIRCQIVKGPHLCLYTYLYLHSVCSPLGYVTITPRA